MILGRDYFVIERQEKAGSLANLCPSSYMCSEIPAEVKDKEKRKRVEDDVDGNEVVISVCEFQQWHV